jgi:carbon-monoxide dehydrogenase medium subunit
MIPAAFEYHSPASIGEATALLARFGDDAKILSGGQSLIPLMKLRLSRPRHIVDINRIPGLDYIRETNGALAIGALARESDLETSDLVRSKYGLLYETSKVVADPVVRNLATVCGNIAHADPSNDHPATMLVLDAEVVATGPAGARRIPIAAFFTGAFTTALRPDEILTEVRIPTPPPRSAGAYEKVERKVGDYATAAVAVQVTLNADGACERVGIAMTGVGPTQIKAAQAEAALRGKRPDAAAITRASEAAAAAADPATDVRGSAEYKRDLVRVLTARALTRAVQSAGAGR